MPSSLALGRPCCISICLPTAETTPFRVSYPSLFPHGERGEDSVWRKVPLVRDNWLAQRAQIMPFKQMLVIEHPNNDEHPQATNEDYEPNAGDKYSQLGDSATVAVLNGNVRAIVVVETFVVIDLGPKTGE